MDRPLHAVAVQGRADRRRDGVDGDNHLQQLPIPPQRGHASGPQRRLPPRLRHAGNHRLQPLRGEAGPENASLPEGLHPRRQQRLHRVGDVRHRRQRRAHH